jgi:hypothetical protein
VIQMQLRQLSGKHVLVSKCKVPACQLLGKGGRIHGSTSALAKPHNLPLHTAGPSHTFGDDWVMTTQVKEVGDGNINYVYVLEGPAGSLCLKQGHPYVRIMKSWKLSQVRHPGRPPLPCLSV